MYEPWHLAAHLVDESTWSGLPELRPTLVRHRVEPGDPAHLAVGLGRIEAAGRGETLLVVTPERPGEGLLERVHDARRAGATVLSLDNGDPQVRGLAHEALSVTDGDDVDLDTVQHLVSAAAGENGAPVPRTGRRIVPRPAVPARGPADGSPATPLVRGPGLRETRLHTPRITTDHVSS